MNPVASEASEVVAQNVIALRKRAGLTQQELADKCCPPISRPRIAEIESGRFNPTVDTLQSVADALEVSVDRLFRKQSKGRLAS